MIPPSLSPYTHCREPTTRTAWARVVVPVRCMRATVMQQTNLLCKPPAGRLRGSTDGWGKGGAGREGVCRLFVMRGARSLGGRTGGACGVLGFHSGWTTAPARGEAPASLSFLSPYVHSMYMRVYTQLPCPSRMATAAYLFTTHALDDAYKEADFEQMIDVPAREMVRTVNSKCTCQGAA